MLKHWGKNRESSLQGCVTDHRGEGDTREKITKSRNWRETAYIPRRRSHYSQRQGLPASKPRSSPVSLSRAHPGEIVAQRKSRHPETHRPKKFTQPEKPETAKQREEKDSNLTFASHEVLASTPWWYYPLEVRSSAGVSRPESWRDH